MYKKYWIAFIVLMTVSFLVLGVVGYKGIQNAPPIPEKVVTTGGTILFDGTTIMDGQNVWQSIGGQEIGSIFGHGAYVAPDWTADYLHRESTSILNQWAVAEGASHFEVLGADRKAVLSARLKSIMRTNTYDSATRTLTIPEERATAFRQLTAYYSSMFGEGRKEFAIARGTLVDVVKQRQMVAFFMWTSWVAATERPGTGGISYTQNWPHEPLVGNTVTSSAIMWSIVSVILLLASIGGVIWYMGSGKGHSETLEPASSDPLLEMKLTPSQKSTVKYFLIVALLFVLQIAFGVIVAHYAVEGDGFYGVKIDEILPYQIARTWHLQIGIFWIATSWLATGLFIAPAVGGREPKFQRLGANILFGALLVVVFGSLTGEWLGIKQKLGNLWFLFGAQGWEYVDLGRVWQILLFSGLLIWLVLMTRAIWPALKRKSEDRNLLTLFLVSSIAIPTFYAAGLMYGQRSHIVTAEYWRWWVVHLWVEGFFEVFATVVIAFLFTRLRLLEIRSATKATLFSTIIYLTGGVIGTFHHLYFTGMQNSALALGAVFSALELVPLIIIGFEAQANIRLAQGTPAAQWIRQYRWPIMFFVSVAFWNLVGAGLFGFLINPPVALYYVQGLNLTPLHGHTALFGVYGMLGLGLLLFSFRAMNPSAIWKERPIKVAFWSINLGLGLMALISLLPIGLLQAHAAIEHGTWYARSAEFMQAPLLQNLRWLRVFGDSLFGVGALIFAWFVLGLVTGHSFDRSELARADDGSPVLDLDLVALPQQARSITAN